MSSGNRSGTGRRPTGPWQYAEPLFLPGDAAREQWLWNSIRRRPDDYATRLGLTATDLGQKMRNVQRLVEGVVRRSDQAKAAVGAMAYDLDRTVPDLGRIVGQREAEANVVPELLVALTEQINAWRRL